MSSDKGPPIANPSPFTGQDRNLTEQFVYECGLVLKGKANAFANDEAKMAFILSYMKGNIAGTWARQYGRLDDQGRPINTQTSTALLANISKDFAEVERRAKYTATLEALRQGKSTVDAYNSTFNMLKEDTGWNEIALTSAYLAGLRREIAIALLQSERPPTTLEEWQSRASKWEITQATYGAGLKAKAFYYPDMFRGETRRMSYPRQDYHPNLSQGEPMDVDGAQIEIDAMRFKKLTQQERNRYMREGRCFRCRQTGHMSRNCPKNTDTGRKPQGPLRPGFSTRPTGFTPRNATRNRGVTVEDQIRDMMNDATPEECAEIALAVHSNLKATHSTENKDFQ